MEAPISKAAAFAILLAVAIIWRLFTRRKRANAPGIGYGSLPIIGTWQGMFTFMKDPKGTISRGVTQYKGDYFRVSSHTTEYVMVCDKQKIAEYLAVPEEVLSFHDSTNELLQTEWTLGLGVAERPYHIPLVRTKLTQSIANNVPGMLAEIQDSFDSLVGSPEQWTEVKLYDTMVRVIARVSNNAFSGMLFCRNEAFLDNAIAYAQSVIITAELLRFFPDRVKVFLKYILPFRKMQRQAREIMGPTVQRRLDSDWKDAKKPNDMIQILIDAAPDEERNMTQIVERMMTLNMASIHTTTMTTTTALYRLAKEPEKYVPELRAEIQQYSVDGKIDKLSLGKLVKLDSFLRECGRVQPLGLISSVRMARKDFTFSDGMIVPKGTAVAVPIMQAHEGAEAGLTNSEEFDGFRYSRMNEASTGPTKHQMVNTDLNYLLFGHGKHACPGRFLAVTEMKLILASLLMKYDLKLIPGTNPKEMFYATARIPEMRLPILMRTIPTKAEA